MPFKHNTTILFTGLAAPIPNCCCGDGQWFEQTAGRLLPWILVQQFLGDRDVGQEQIEGQQISRTDPFDSLVVAQFDAARRDPGPVGHKPELPCAQLEGYFRNVGPDRDDQVELLEDFPRESLSVILALFNLSAWELPAPLVPVSGALSEQDPSPVFDDSAYYCCHLVERISYLNP